MYGELMRTRKFAHVLAGARFLHRGKTREKFAYARRRLHMVVSAQDDDVGSDLDGSEVCHLVGEVYIVDDATIARLDNLEIEGTQGAYVRREILYDANHESPLLSRPPSVANMYVSRACNRLYREKQAGAPPDTMFRSEEWAARVTDTPLLERIGSSGGVRAASDIPAGTLVGWMVGKPVTQQEVEPIENINRYINVTARPPWMHWQSWSVTRACTSSDAGIFLDLHHHSGIARHIRRFRHHPNIHIQQDGALRAFVDLRCGQELFV